MLRRTVRRDIEIVADIADGLATCGDSTSLHQAVMNLCLNARDAMPHGGTLTLRARGELAPDGAPADEEDAQGTVVLSVRDTGVGMSDETMAQVFEPFYTTKAAGLGFGLGLASVREIAQRHGGKIEIESEIDRGTVLRLRLPAAQPSQLRRAITPPPAPSRPPGAGITVLLADDEEVVRRSVRRLLERDGYSVLEAADGREAISVWAAAEPKPAVAVLDIDMPQLDGVTALRQLRHTAPRLAAVFLSGHRDPSAEREIAALGAAELLLKPHSVGALLQALAAALTETSGPDDERAGGGLT